MKRLLCGGVLLFLLVTATFHQSNALKNRPIELKLGPVLSPVLVNLLAPEHATTLAFRSVVRVMFYFGSFFEDNPNLVQTAPEYVRMYQHLRQAVKLDPYNLDAYYFAQAAFTWEVGRVREVNAMLDYGMQYRTKDYLLPFYAGFNAAYFLKDYSTAARYFQMASERSGNTLFVNLASRYFHEADQTQMGLVYLESMIKGANDRKTRLIYEQRRDALLAVQVIKEAIARYREGFDRDPLKLNELIEHGFLTSLPVDPYGGTFYLDEQSKVRTTSKFSIHPPERAPANAETSLMKAD